MSDLFLEDVPDDFIEAVFTTMRRSEQHVFQVLTKRPSRMLEWTRKRYKNLNWPGNIWLGVSIENTDYLPRAKLLSSTPAKIRFVSFEPLLGPIHLENGSLRGVSWAIVGGESGARARPMKPEWVDTIFTFCRTMGIPFFFKQWGTFDSNGNRVGKKNAGRHSALRTSHHRKLPFS
jgi:protein gp37